MRPWTLWMLWTLWTLRTLFYTIHYTIHICFYTVSPVGEADRDVRALLEIETRGFAEQAEDAASTLYTLWMLWTLWALWTLVQSQQIRLAKTTR